MEQGKQETHMAMLGIILTLYLSLRIVSSMGHRDCHQNLVVGNHTLQIFKNTVRFEIDKERSSPRWARVAANWSPLGVM